MYHIYMQVDFYMFLDANAEFGIPDGQAIRYDDANDIHNPFSVHNFKRHFEIESDDFL